jgi:hypothetical protein
MPQPRSSVLALATLLIALACLASLASAVDTTTAAPIAAPATTTKASSAAAAQSSIAALVLLGLSMSSGLAALLAQDF